MRKTEIYEGKIRRLEKEIEIARNARIYLIKNVRILNERYERKELSLEKYRESLRKFLNCATVEEWSLYYKERIEHCQNLISQYVREQDKKD